MGRLQLVCVYQGAFHKCLVTSPLPQNSSKNSYSCKGRAGAQRFPILGKGHGSWHVLMRPSHESIRTARISTVGAPSRMRLQTTIATLKNTGW